MNDSTRIPLLTKVLRGALQHPVFDRLGCVTVDLLGKLSRPPDPPLSAADGWSFSTASTSGSISCRPWITSRRRRSTNRSPASSSLTWISKPAFGWTPHSPASSALRLRWML